MQSITADLEREREREIESSYNRAAGAKMELTYIEVKKDHEENALLRLPVDNNMYNECSFRVTYVT